MILAYMSDHLEVTGHELQHLRHILAELAKLAATVRAGAAVANSGADVQDGLAWQMCGQRTARRRSALSHGGDVVIGSRCNNGRGRRRGRHSLQHLQSQFDLRDLEIQLLTGATKLPAPQL